MAADSAVARGVAALGRRTPPADTVCHFPPARASGTRSSIGSFRSSSMNWRGKPLISYQVIVSLIAATHHAGRPAGRSGARSQPVSGGGEGPRRRGTAGQSETGALSWRLELHRRTSSVVMSPTSEHLLSDDSLGASWQKQSDSNGKSWPSAGGGSAMLTRRRCSR